MLKDVDVCCLSFFCLEKQNSPQRNPGYTCAMADEGEIKLFTFCSSNDLLALGWIHTHPSQKCFLSSVDVHTHCAYQIMMKEVCCCCCALHVCFGFDLVC